MRHVTMCEIIWGFSKGAVNFILRIDICHYEHFLCEMKCYAMKSHKSHWISPVQVLPIYLTFGFLNSKFNQSNSRSNNHLHPIACNSIFLQFDSLFIFNESWHSQSIYSMLRLDNIKQRITKYISQYRLDFDLLNEANQFYLQTLINNLQCWKSYQTKHWVNRSLYQGHKSR